MSMAMQASVTCRLVKGQDLNHHGTLYAGRQAEWFVEAGFVAAASLTNPANIVCLNIHGMTFKRPVKKGEVITYESRIVLSTRTKLIAYVRLFSRSGISIIVDGFLTFVHVDENGSPIPHGITVEADCPELLLLQEQAKKL